MRAGLVQMTVGEFEQFQAREKRAREQATKGGVSLDQGEMQKRWDAVMADMAAGGNGKIDFNDPKWERKHKRKLRAAERAAKKRGR